MNIYVVSQSNDPIDSPISLEEAKIQVRVKSSVFDDQLNELIPVATEIAEQITGRAIFNTQFKAQFKKFYTGSVYLIEPLQNVDSITY